MEKPKVFNRHHQDAPTDAVYVGRGSPWGNPFRISSTQTREQVIERFRCETLPTLDVRPLIGRSLICYCTPRACHADVLLKAAALAESKAAEQLSDCQRLGDLATRNERVTSQPDTDGGSN